MKKFFANLIYIFLFVSLCGTISHAQVTLQPDKACINCDTPEASAVLEIESTDKGILVPRMTTTQRTDITSPANGLLVFDETNGSFWFYRTEMGWEELATRNGSRNPTSINDTDNDTKIQTEASADEDVIRFDIAGDEKWVMVGSRLEPMNTGKSIFIGEGAGEVDDLTDNENVAIGFEALNLNTTGAGNTVLGNQNMTLNSSGTENTSIGVLSLKVNTTGSQNTSVGASALFSNDSGIGNTATGLGTLYSNTTANHNTAIGRDALFRNTERSELVAVGFNSLYNNGLGATASNEAIENTAVGTRALQQNTLGAGNTGIGFQALRDNTTGISNTALGKDAMTFNVSGEDNTANGTFSLYSNTTGNLNTAIGKSALFFNDDGVGNTALGAGAALNNISSDHNIAIGRDALFVNTDRSENIAIGLQALYHNGTGTTLASQAIENTAVGTRGLIANTTGAKNTAVGFNVLKENTTGTSNTAVGESAGITNTVGTDLLLLGKNADVSLDNLTDATAIGASATVNLSNKIRVGNTGITVIEGQVDFSCPSDGRFKHNVKEEVPGLEFITKLRPVTYNFNTEDFDKHVRPEGWEKNYSKEKLAAEQQAHAKNFEVLHTGFIAQEVEATAKEIGYDFHGVYAPKNEKDNYGLRYGEFTVPLVKAVQELSLENEQLEMQLEEVEENYNNVITKLDRMEKMIAQLQGCCVEKEESQNSSLQIELGNMQNGKGAYLEQNAPNPFYDETIIKYYLPKNFKSATMRFTDWQGRNLKTIQLQDAGEGTISISAKELEAGTYAYTLVVDGKLVDTNKMILTR